ncbi:MAG: HAD family hydrolase [Wenzhouxiangellaceae bacterium]
MDSGAACYCGVFFDFDYTLVDSGDAIAACFGEALSRNGDAPVAADVIKPMIGLPLKQMYHRVIRQVNDDPGEWQPTGILGAAGPGDIRSHVDQVDEPAFEARYDAFLAFYAAAADCQMVAGSRLYPGVENLLQACRNHGCRTAIVTNKASARVNQFLDFHALGDLVELVVGSDTVSRPKPHPMGLNRALMHFGLPAAGTLYVGDSLLDMHAAHSAGMPFAAVCTGHHGPADFNVDRTAHIAVNLAGLVPTIVAAIATSIPASVADSNAAPATSTTAMHSASSGRRR